MSAWSAILKTGWFRWYSSLKHPSDGCEPSIRVLTGARYDRIKQSPRVLSNVGWQSQAVFGRGPFEFRPSPHRSSLRRAGCAGMSDQRITSPRLKSGMFGYIQLSHLCKCNWLGQTPKGKVPKNFALHTSVAGARGFEPRLTDPKTGVLPLDDAPTAPSCPKAHRAGCSVPNGSQTVKKKPTLQVMCLSIEGRTCTARGVNGNK
jgi:hypothetical protein